MGLSVPGPDVAELRQRHPDLVLFWEPAIAGCFLLPKKAPKFRSRSSSVLQFSWPDSRAADGPHHFVVPVIASACVYSRSRARRLKYALS